MSVVRPRTRLLRVVVGGQAGVNRHHRKDSFVLNSRLDIVDHTLVFGKFIILDQISYIVRLVKLHFSVASWLFTSFLVTSIFLLFG